MVEPHGVHHLVLDVPDEVGALPDRDGLGQRERPVGAPDLGVARTAVQELHVHSLAEKKKTMYNYRL